MHVNILGFQWVEPCKNARVFQTLTIQFQLKVYLKAHWAFNHITQSSSAKLSQCLTWRPTWWRSPKSMTDEIMAASDLACHVDSVNLICINKDHVMLLKALKKGVEALVGIVIVKLLFPRLRITFHAWLFKIFPYLSFFSVFSSVSFHSEWEMLGGNRKTGVRAL